MATQNHRPDRHKQKTVSFRLPEPLTTQLRALARRNRRTFSGEAQLAIEKHLAAHGLGPVDGEVSAKPKRNLGVVDGEAPARPKRGP